MYTRPGIALLSDMHFAMMLLFGTEFGLMYTGSTKNLLQTYILVYCCVLTQLLV